MLARPAVDESLVFRKSGLGAAQLAAAHSAELSVRERHVLILLDGRRTVGELSELLGAETVQRAIPALKAKGFAKRVDPQVGAEWALTQLHVGQPAVVPPKPSRPVRSDGHPLRWALLLFVVAVWSTHWIASRYRTQAAEMWRFDPLPPTAVSALASAGPGDGGLQHPATVAIAPIGRPPSAGVAKPAPAAAATRAAAPVVTRTSLALGRAQPRLPSPVRPAAPAPRPEAAPPPADPAPQAQTAAPAPDPAADSGPAPQPAEAAVTPGPVQAPAPPATEVAMAGPPAQAAAPPATEVAMADPPAQAAAPPATEVAMAAPPAQAAAGPPALRPLRNDPPRIPERAQRDGIVQGQARVRLWITPEGTVDQVDIIDAKPPGVFDDEVRRTLSLWTFEPPGRPVDQVMELPLKP